MDVLNQIIEVMNKEDVRYFKLFAYRTNSVEVRKDMQLFDYIRKSGADYNEEKIIRKLKYKEKNPFYRLKDRLVEDINKAILARHYEQQSATYLLHLLSLGRYYYSKEKFRLALYYTTKAEKEGKKLEDYEFLDIIYGDFIKLSQSLVSFNPEEYIKKREQNRVQLNAVRQIDDVVAALRYRLKITQNFSEKDHPILKFLEKTIDEFSRDKSIKNSPKLRFMIYSAVSQVLLQKHDYKTLESYLLKTYTQFKKENLFNKNNHTTKLQMLSFIVNSLFKNNKYNQSLKYAEQLKVAMTEYNNMLYENYTFFYYNSLVINYSVIDKNKAIDILEELKVNNVLKNNPFYELFVYLNLAIFTFEKKEYSRSIKNLTKLYIHDNYKNADKVLKFKIAVAELIIRYELKDEDFIEHRIKQIGKDFKELIIKKEYNREKEFMSLMREMIVTDNIKKDKKVFERVENFIRSGISDDSEIINYNNWLKGKL